MSRTTESFAQFFYRFHPDKSIDAICGYCFTESQPVKNQEDLDVWQMAHRCAHWIKQTA